jgi:predicted nucleic acid-binding Zn ribbon protein
VNRAAYSLNATSSFAMRRSSPECRKKSLKKVMTPVGIVFKGSGFYATDHKSPSGQVKRESKKDAPATEIKEPKESKETKDSKETKPAKSEGSE